VSPTVLQGLASSERIIIKGCLWLSKVVYTLQKYNNNLKTDMFKQKSHEYRVSSDTPAFVALINDYRWFTRGADAFMDIIRSGFLLNHAPICTGKWIVQALHARVNPEFTWKSTALPFPSPLFPSSSFPLVPLSPSPCSQAPAWEHTDLEAPASCMDEFVLMTNHYHVLLKTLAQICQG